MLFKKHLNELSKIKIIIEQDSSWMVWINHRLHLNHSAEQAGSNLESEPLGYVSSVRSRKTSKVAKQRAYQ